MGLFDSLARNIGSGIADLIKRPDGAFPDVTAFPTNIAQGAASLARNAISSASTTALSALGLNSATVSPTSKLTPVQRGQMNVLENFASYTTLFTLACLKPEEINNPFIYRNSSFGMKQVVFSSAGRFDAARAGTAYGSPEYFVNNVEITSVVTGTPQAGSSNSVKFSFEVYEPYSMGLLLQSLQVAATSAGYANYLNSANFVLVMEFVGYDQNGTLFKGATPKFFPIKLTNTSFSVTESGSIYKMEAVPSNHVGFSTVHNTLFNDISITGSTVKDLLSGSERSLTIVLNEFEEKLVREGQKEIPDRYEVHFPETSDSPIPGVEPSSGDSKATVNSSNKTVIGKKAILGFDPTEFGDNTIGSASFNFQIDSGGNYVAPKASESYDEKTGKVDRDKVTIEPNVRTFQYSKDQTLVEIIQQSVLESDYAAKALSGKNLDGNGRLQWFRVDVQVQLLEYDNKRQDYAKRIIYRVLPYKLHVGFFTNPNAAPPGYEELIKSIVKQYNYIYTGQNNDLLKFDIQLNNAFYTAIAPTAPHEAGRVANSDVQTSGEPKIVEQTINTGEAGTEAATAETGGRPAKPASTIKLPFGGSGNLTPEQVVANTFHTAFLQSAKSEMVNIDVDILGDPFWLMDSGYGGYFAGPGMSEQVTSDDTANYEMGDIYIYIRFRTPIEPKEQNGDYMFIEGEDSPFSGIYKVTQVASKFVDGTFKQSMKCTRMPLQPNDFDNKLSINKETTEMYKSDKEVRQPSTPYEDQDGTTESDTGVYDA